MAAGRLRGAVRRARGATRGRPRHGRPCRAGPCRAGTGARVAGAGQARGPGRHLRPHLERCDPGQHAGAVAAGHGRLGGLARGLRAAAGRLPGRRLANAEFRRPRPGPAPVRRAARRRPGRPRCPHPGAARDHPRQPALSRVPPVGAARQPGQLRDRRRPRCRTRARLPGRHRRLLPAVPRGPVRAGAGPLPADRHRPGPDRGSRTGACRRHRPPARRYSGRTAPGYPAARHLTRRRGAAGAGGNHRPDRRIS